MTAAATGGPGAGSTPLYPLEGAVSWNMNTVCNYRCSYCTQRFLDDRRAWARDIPAFLDGFRRLPGDWEIKLSGGEPFQHPDFLPLVGALADAGRRVSVVTNFSAAMPTLRRYAERVASRAGVFSASLHLEYVDVGTFLEKAAAFATEYPGSFNVTCVATRTVLPTLGALRGRFAERGIRFKVQPEKQDRDVVIYAAAERAAIEALGGHNDTGEIAPDYSGRACWSGSRYFILDHRGEAWRCYPARRQKTEHLGNFLAPGFRLDTAATPCRYTYCNCTVPRERGMVGGG